MSAPMTIAAIATGPAAGGIGVIRVSGPCALEAARALAPGLPKDVAVRHAYATGLCDLQGGLLDEGVVIYFQAPRSFTGEDVVELQAHGSPSLLSLLLRELLADPRVRLAEPGEFTRRAFLNGRIDLARAEAVADLVAADSEAAVRAAAAQVAGELSARVGTLVELATALRADLEAVLSFPDEAQGAEADALPRLSRALELARSLLADERRGRLVRRGAKVVLFGPVNAGKSTLFNRLLGEARALVDPEPGTTRDALEARLTLAGLAVTLLDSAGLREDAARLEALGIERTREALRGADLAVLVVPPGASAGEVAAWSAEAGVVPLVRVASKADLRAGDGAALDVAVSGLSGEGVEALRSLLLDRLGGPLAGSVALVSERHADVLRRVVEHLEGARAALEVATLEVASGELGLALEALGELSGQCASAALLDEIFRRFCIGK